MTLYLTRVFQDIFLLVQDILVLVKTLDNVSDLLQSDMGWIYSWFAPLLQIHSLQHLLWSVWWISSQNFSWKNAWYKLLLHNHNFQCLLHDLSPLDLFGFCWTIFATLLITTFNDSVLVQDNRTYCKYSYSLTHSKCQQIQLF